MAEIEIIRAGKTIEEYGTPKKTQKIGGNYTANKDNAAYRKNMTVEIPQKWYQGDAPTSRELLGRIGQISQTDSAKASQLYAGYKQLQQNKSSRYYNPYTQPTNAAVGNLKAMGIDVSNIDDDWYNKYSWLKNYYTFTGTTNTPSKPGKKASAEELAAYEYYQLAKSEEATKKAETQWKALQEEVSYLANDPYRNYSDQEIMDRIDWSKYGALTNMEEAARLGAPVELNRAIDFSRDNLHAVIWATRNDGGTGNMETDLMYSAMGAGKQWQKNQIISDRLDPMSENYNPYVLGSTLEQEGKYFNRYSFDQQWLDDNRGMLASNDLTERNNYIAVSRAEEFTQKAIAENQKLTEELEKRLLASDGTNQETLLKWLENQLGKSDYSSLKKLNESLNETVLPTTRAINFDLNAMKQRIADECARKAALPTNEDAQEEISADVGAPSSSSKQDGTIPIPEPETEEQAEVDAVSSPQPPSQKPDTSGAVGLVASTGVRPVKFTEQQKQDFKIADIHYQEGMDTIGDDATEAEAAVRENAGSVTHNDTVGFFKGLIDMGFDARDRFAEKMIQRSTGISSSAILSTANTIADYEQQENRLGAMMAWQNDLKEMIGADLVDNKDILNIDLEYLTDNALPDSVTKMVNVDGVDIDVQLDIDSWADQMFTWYGEDDNDGFAYIHGTDEYANSGNGIDQAKLKSAVDALLEEENKKLKLAYDLMDKGLTEEQLRYIDEARKNAEGIKELQEQQDASREAYDAALRKRQYAEAVRDTTIKLLNAAGADTYALEAAVPVTDFLLDFTKYEPTQWESYSVYNDFATAMYARGDDFASALSEMSEADGAVTEAIDVGRWVLDYADRNGITIPDEVRNNLERYIAKMERTHEDYEFVSVIGNDDFKEGAAEGKKKIEEQLRFDYDAFDKAMEANPENMEAWMESQPMWNNLSDDVKQQLLTQLADYGPSWIAGEYESKLWDVALRGKRFGLYEVEDLLTDYEKDIFYYLAEKQGLDKAREYFDFLTDDSYGVLNTRAGDVTRKAASDLVNSGAGGAILANVGSVLLAPVAAVSGVYYAAKTGLEQLAGQDVEFNPDNIYLTANLFRNSSMEATVKAIDDNIQNPILNKIAQAGLEIFRNRGDSIMNAVTFGALFPWMGSISNEMLREFTSALPMGMSAAVDATAEAKRNGAEDWQAYAIAGVTMFAETATEAISLDNIHNAFKIGRDVNTNTVKDFLKNWLTQAGISEAFGESINEIIENYADRKILKELSGHSQLVKKYKAENPGISDEEAEARAWKDELAGILHTALISYITPGLDVVSFTAGRASSYFNYIRTETKRQQKSGSNLSMLDVMKADLEGRKAIKEMVESGELQQAVEEELNGAVSQEETTQEKEPRRPQKEIEAEISRDWEILEAGIGGRTTTETAAVSAVLDIDGSYESKDEANAAAVYMSKVFTEGSTAETLQELLLGTESEGDPKQVKQAVINAVLGGNASEAFRTVTSQAFRQASINEKAQMLIATLPKDSQNAQVAQSKEKNVREVRIAEAEKSIIANGSMDQARAANDKAEQAAANTAEAQSNLTERQKEVETAGEAITAAGEELQNAQGNDERRADAENQMAHAIKQKENAVKVQEEYEQHLANTQGQQTAAEQTAQREKQNGLRTTREQAEAIINQENQQRAEERAKAQAEKFAQEQKARQAQAEEDVRSGKAEELADNEQIEQYLAGLNISEEERNAFRERMIQRRDQQKLGKIDMNGKLTTAEGYLALRALERRTGLSIQFADDLGAARGKYANGVVYLNRQLAQSGQMTTGQALVECALHEITHSLEGTKHYAKYAETVMNTLFGDDVNKKQAAIDQKIADYAKHGVKLEPTDAEKEIVADFARTRLNQKDTVERFMDAGLGGRMRNLLHNINQTIRNFKLTGEEKKTAENLRRAERLFQKALVEKAATSVHPAGDQFSIAQFAEAAGMYFDETTLKLYDRKGGNEIKEVTPEMISDTPVGQMIDLALNGFKDKSGKVILNPTITKDSAQAQKKLFADLMTMICNYKNSNLVWEIAGSTLYSALKSNADAQYTTTVDFGTICAKTQEIVNVLSRVMKEKAAAGDDSGLTRSDVLKVYNETAKAGLTVPCPVCYVFSRWMGVPSMLGQMAQFQKKYVSLDNPNDIKSINWDKTEQIANDYIKGLVDKYNGFDNVKKASADLTKELDKLEKQRMKAAQAMESVDATKEEKESARKEHNGIVDRMVEIDKSLTELEAFNWVTQALCETDSRKNPVVENGVYKVDRDNFEVTPNDVLFDLNATNEFIKYPKNWAYRTSRGSQMGKAIMPYSGMSLGDIIHGVSRWATEQNPLLNYKTGNNVQKAAAEIQKAIDRARKQNLIGGQRLQSTSDFRPEWGLDYIMAFLEMQAIGSKVQMYTKVAEAVPLLASMGGDINLSIMGAGKGWHIDENGNYVLDFSSVTGMAYETAKSLKNQYNNVQMILVGMNDTHIRLALANSDIDFVIPWHSSGNTKDVLASMIASVNEKLETGMDYQNVQSDKVSKTQTAEQANLWNLRMKILTGADLTLEDRETIYGDKYLNRLYVRFNLEGDEARAAIARAKENGDDFLEKHYSRFNDARDEDCFNVQLNSPQAAQIFPYEYWDTSLTKENANDNGWNFIEYCQHFGIVPRFSGGNQTMEGGKKEKIGNFAGAVYDKEGAAGKNIIGYDRNKMYDGYWKLLIDRPMYNNDGTYHAQSVVDVTKANVGHLDNGKLSKDSQMPLSTSALYTSKGRNDIDIMTSEDEAVYNSIAAVSPQVDLVGQNSFYGDATDADVDQMLDQANEQTIEDRRNAIYVKDGHLENGDTVDFIGLMLDGIKKGETREHNRLSRSQWLGLAKDGQVYGRVKFGEPRILQKYDSDGNLTQDYIDSAIEGTEYDISDGETKYYYPIEDIQDFRDNPQPILRNGNYGQYSINGETTDSDVDQMLIDAGVLQDEYAAPLEGMNPMATTAGGEAQRQFGSENGMLRDSDEIAKQAIAYVMNQDGYDPDTNAAQLDRAMNWIRSNKSTPNSDGLYEALQKVINNNFDYRSADGQARMIALMGMAAAKNDVLAQTTLADAFNRQGTDLGRMLQARKLFRLMTPEGRKASLESMAQQVSNEFLKNGYQTDIKFSDWVLQAAAAAQTEEEFDMVRDVAAKEIAEQVPSNWKDRFRTWRMLSMLGNPRTHFRNLTGNAIFMPVVKLKNVIGAGIEEQYAKRGLLGEGERTKAIKFTEDAKIFAAEDAEKMRRVLTGESKYGDANRVKREMKPFGDSWVQKSADFNSDLLEKEDWLFLNHHYQAALASYMTANGWTHVDMKDQKKLDAARAYAVLEAQKATYRDANKISDKLNQWSRDGGFSGFLVDATLPFKKTPANILRRGVEYSPVGLVKSLAGKKRSLEKYSNWEKSGFAGEMPRGAKTLSQALDDIAAGASGTLIAAIGAALSALGAVKLKHDSDDDEDRLDVLEGAQDYSIEMFGLSMTLDWAAPVCMPFFTGAAIYQSIADMADGDVDIGAVIEGIAGITDPVFNLSMLDGVSSLIKSVSYSKHGPVPAMLSKIGANYATSYVPSFFGAVARTADNTRRKAFTESGAALNDWLYGFEQAQNKLPYLSTLNIPYRNEWGEPDVTNRVWAFMENFVFPGYVNKIRPTALSENLRKIYTGTGEDVLNSATPKKLGGEALTDKEYDQYAVTSGQTAQKLLTQLFENPDYASLIDTNPDALVPIIGSIYSYSNHMARQAVDAGYSTTTKWLNAASESDDPLGIIMDQSEQKAKKATQKMNYDGLYTSINNSDAVGAATSVQALKDSGKSDSDIRTQLTKKYKQAYIDAYRNGDDDEYERIESLLTALDLGNSSYDEDDFSKWLKGLED